LNDVVAELVNLVGGTTGSNGKSHNVNKTESVVKHIEQKSFQPHFNLKSSHKKEDGNGKKHSNLSQNVSKSEKTLEEVIPLNDDDFKDF